MKVLAIGGGVMGRRRLCDLTYLNSGEVILFEPMKERCEEESTLKPPAEAVACLRRLTYPVNLLTHFCRARKPVLISILRNHEQTNIMHH